MTKNYYFRQFECGLSIKETANLCFKSVRTVKNWDNGKAIPKECKRLMRMNKGLLLHCNDEWEGFRIEGGKLKTPLGTMVTPREILTGLALLEIQSEVEVKTSTYLLKTARLLAKNMSK